MEDHELLLRRDDLEVKTDFPEIASMAIGDITIDPNNHDVIYAGTGDLRYGSFSFGAAGVLKSTDKGETWSLLGEDVFTPLYGPSAGGFPQYQAIGKVVVDPNNSNNVIVGTKTGIYFSYDAGHRLDRPVLHEYVHGSADTTPGRDRFLASTRRHDDCVRRSRHARLPDARATRSRQQRRERRLPRDMPASGLSGRRRLDPA